MKTLIATAILAMAIASPALAQRAQSAPQRGYQSQQNGYYNGYPVQEWVPRRRVATARVQN
jgi:hypothetical protein